MRKDMPKLLCEDGRRNGGPGAKKYKRRQRRRLKRQLQKDPESAPKRGSMSGQRVAGWNFKELNETLNPLARFLESRVGRPWDEVYSEIRAGLNLNSAVQLHIMQHLWQYVNRDIKVADCGTLVEPSLYGWSGGKRIAGRGSKEYTVGGRGGWRPYLSSSGYRFVDLYVHPETGILRDARADGRKLVGRGRRNKAPKTSHKEGGRHFVKEKGIWYEVEIVPLPKGVKWGERGPVTSRRSSAARFYKDREVVPERWHLEYGPKDHFFGPVGGKETTGGRFSVGHVPPNLAQVKAHYGSLKVYCPVGAKRRQLGSKELRRLGLKNGDS